MRFLAVIPARFPSTRLEGKPLLLLGERTVIQRVWDATVESGEFDDVVVATDDDRIAEAVQGFGGTAVMTSPDLANGSERVAAAADLLPDHYDVVANIQGDQPFVSADAIRALLAPFGDDTSAEMTTVAMPLSPELVDDPNTVKIVTDVRGRALYFSRSLIPANPAGLCIRTSSISASMPSGARFCADSPRSHRLLSNKQRIWSSCAPSNTVWSSSLAWQRAAAWRSTPRGLCTRTGLGA